MQFGEDTTILESVGILFRNYLFRYPSTIFPGFARKYGCFIPNLEYFCRGTKNSNILLKSIMEAKEKVLTTMKEAGVPLNAGKIAELSGLDKKDVEKAMKQLKEEGAIVSPIRCKWAPAE